MNQNLELGKTHEEVIQELHIPRTTYYRRVKEVMNEDAKAWDKVHIDSVKYRAVRLIDSLLNCVILCKSIMNNPNEDSRVRIEASQTLCIAEAQIFKLVESGPVFRVQIPDNNKIQVHSALTDNSTTEEQLSLAEDN